MAIDIKNFSSSLKQLVLEFDVQDEAEPASVSAEERSRRALQALQTLKAAFADGGELRNTAWSGDFFKLLELGWPPRIAAYIAWASSPKDSRYPKTQEELATRYLGLTSDRAISTWRQKYPSIDEAIGLMQSMPLLEHRRAVFEALAQSASDPSFHGAQDRKTFLQMTADYTPHEKIEFETTPGKPVQYTDEQLDAAIERLKERKNDSGSQ